MGAIKIVLPKKKKQIETGVSLKLKEILYILKQTEVFTYLFGGYGYSQPERVNLITRDSSKKECGVQISGYTDMDHNSTIDWQRSCEFTQLSKNEFKITRTSKPITTTEFDELIIKIEKEK